MAGTVTELARTLQSAAERGAVVVGAAVERATRAVIDYRPLGATAGQGPAGADPAPAPAWVALRTRASGPSADEPAARTPLVERAGELELLTRLFALTRRELRPRLVTLAGPAGIGKSRLVAELGRAVDDDPELVTWRAGRSLPYGDGVTFWALGEVAKSQAGVTEADPAEAAEAKLERTAADVLSDEADAAWVARHLRRLVSPDGQAGWPGPERRIEAFAAWRRFLTALAAQRPLVVVLEDLHWADDAMLDFVEELIERATAVPMFVVATARPELFERRPGWGGGRDATTTTIEPLSETGTMRLLDALLGESVLPQAARAALVAGAGGNPLFVEEYVSLLREASTGGERSRVSRAARGGSPLPIPASLHALVTERLEATDRGHRALVAHAAVLGRTVCAGGVAEVAGMDAAAVATGLARLERRGLLCGAQSSTMPGQTEWSFRHDLVREVAYGQLTRAELAIGHTRAAAWLQSLGDRGAERAELLAHHLCRALESTAAPGTGDLAVQARRALRDAGDRAFGLTAYPAAARYYAAAAELWPPGDSTDGHERPALLLRLSETAHLGGAADPKLLAEARDGLLAAGRDADAAKAEALLAALAGHDGRSDEARAHLDRAVELAGGAPASPVKATVLAALATRLAAGRDRERAVDLGSRARELASALGLRHLEALSLQAAGLARAGLGDPSGLDDQELAARMLQGLRAPEAEVALDHLGTMHKWMGDLRAGRAAQAAGRRVAERFGTVYRSRHHPEQGRTQVRDDCERAADCFSTGRWAEARGILAQLIADSATGPPNELAVPMRCIRGRILLADGDLAGATAEAGHDQGQVDADLRGQQPALQAAEQLVQQRGGPLVVAPGQAHPGPERQGRVALPGIGL